MEIWLDTTNVRLVQKAKRLGLLSGVTTNPTLIAKSERDLEEILKDLLHHQEGHVTVQVVSDETTEMVQQGQSLYSFSNRLVIKVPVTKSGLEALHLLSRQGIPTMATAICHPRQAIVAALAGADYLAPYLSRVQKAGSDPWSMLKTISHFLQTYRLKTKILAASLQNLDDVMSCSQTGIFGITLKDDLFEKLIDNDPLTLKSVEQFNEDWKCVSSPLFVS